MENADWIYRVLDDHSIAYEAHTHAPVHTMQECAYLPFLTEDVVFCKNVMLCNRQQTDYYLVLLRPDDMFRTATVSKQLGVSRLSFAPNDALPKLLNVQSGAVSPLALFFDLDRRVKLCYERSLEDAKRYAFHPCDNSQTVILSHDVFWDRLVPLFCREPIPISLTEPPVNPVDLAYK